MGRLTHLLHAFEYGPGVAERQTPALFGLLALTPLWSEALEDRLNGFQPFSSLIRQPFHRWC